MRKLLLIGLATAIAGCASMRGVEVGSDPGAQYRIDVYNSRPDRVTVAYEEGGAPIQLGAVAARATERFVIASPRTTSITVRAYLANGNSAGTYTVSLTAGETARLTIR